VTALVISATPDKTRLAIPMTAVLCGVARKARIFLGSLPAPDGGLAVLPEVPRAAPLVSLSELGPGAPERNLSVTSLPSRATYHSSDIGVAIPRARRRARISGRICSEVRSVSVMWISSMNAQAIVWPLIKIDSPRRLGRRYVSQSSLRPYRQRLCRVDGGASPWA
jgi:hypothetical protein